MTTKISTANIQPSTLEVLQGGGGTTVYPTITELPLSGNESGDLAFVAATNRLYIWNGTGWFNIALINTNPTITQGPNPSYTFATNGTPIVLTLLASDPEGIPITWSSQVTSGSLGNTATISQNGNVFTITPSTNEADIGTFGVTFTASDGVNIATAGSSFTLAFAAADQFYNQSVVLTTSDVNNGNNNTFVDSSTNNFAITRNGNTTQGTFSPFSPAGWSGYFDGTGDWLTFTGATTGSGNFTTEAWVNLSVLKDYQVIFDNRGTGASATGYALGVDAAGKPYMYTNEGFRILSSITIGANAWNHLALVRSGTTITLYVNGVSGGTFTSSANFSDTNSGIGVARTFTPTSQYFGYISNLRIVNGTALYTTNFTPPTAPLTAVSGTSLLILQDNRFIDRSTNNFAITRNGDARITPFSPFRPTVQYSPSVHGGSAFFDGSGTNATNIADYLSVAANSAFEFPGNFTWECWFNSASLSGFRSLFGNYTTGAATDWYIRTADAQLQVYLDGGTLRLSANIIPNAWYHFVIVRNGSTITGYLNGTSFGSYTSASTIGTVNKIIYIGSQGAGAEPFNGYISGLRFVKGTALYTANFTPPTAPLTAIANTSLLLNFTNLNIFDETGKVVVETVSGARASTTTAKYGDTSIFFNGSTDSLVMPASPLLAYGTENFTIEAWVYPTTLSGTKPIIESRSSGASATGYAFLVNSSGQLNVYLSNGFLGASTTALQANVWSHVALVRTGTGSNQTRYFINGVAAGTITMSNNLTDAIANITRVGASTSAGELWPGYISDLRITRGHARYTANFTPPTQKLGYNNAE